MNKNNYTVYMHVFPNGKTYIGITKQDVNKRWGNNGSGYKDQPVYNAILEFGWDNIEHIIIDSGLDYEYAQKLEKYYISKFDSINNGYNISKGGGLGGSSWCLFEYNGKLYSPEQLSKLSKYNITAHDITTRINCHKWSVEKAISTPLMEKNILFNYNGKEYTINELYNIRKNKDITLNQLRNRLLKHNWNIERAISQPTDIKKQPHGVGERIYEYNGQMYNSYELCQLSKYDITSSDITCRINHHGWSVEKAINTPKRNSKVMYEYNGEMYSANDIIKFASYDNILPKDIRDRVRNGWSIKRALTTPKR